MIARGEKFTIGFVCFTEGSNNVLRGSIFSLLKLFVKIKVVYLKKFGVLFLFQNFYSLSFFFNIINGIEENLLVKKISFFLVNSKRVTSNLFFNIFSLGGKHEGELGYSKLFVDKKFLWGLFVLNYHLLMFSFFFLNLPTLKWHQFTNHL